MPNFNSQKDKEAFVESQYEKNRTESKIQRAEDRAEKAYRQNRILLIFTIILGFLGLLVDILSNLDSISASIALLFCK